MSSNENAIVKKILHPGNKTAKFQDGTKVVFHFQTRLCNAERTLLDDSKKLGNKKPLELVLGKKFKMEVWEAIVQRMAVNEVAQFTIDKTLVAQYPFVSKTIREAAIPASQRNSHCCAMTLQTEGMGHPDLNELLKFPSDLEFTIELLRVEQPDEYQKESWQMNDGEQLKRVQELRAIGNKKFQEKDYAIAADTYSEAIGLLERLVLKEKPQSDEWNNINKLKVPFLLNFSQCKLSEGDFYAVIEHCTTVLKTEPDNVKALFRRAKAHVGAWNPDEAKTDFGRVMELDSTLITVVNKELQVLDELIKHKNKTDKEKLRGLFVT